MAVHGAVVSWHADYAAHSDDIDLEGECRCTNEHALLNARVSLELTSLPFEVSLWGGNLANEGYFAQSVDFRRPVGCDAR
jgi:hypothetical protein